MSTYECSITNHKKQLEFYKDLSEQLQVENKQLKKQLEEYDRKLFFTKNELDMRQKSIDNKLNQQKEFIDWLEDKIKFSTKPTTCVLLKSILQNYKEIIGGKE